MANRESKGQAGIETLIVISILSLIFIFVFSAYVEREREIGWSDEFTGAKRECYRVSSLINRVRANGKNFLETVNFNTHSIHINGDLRSITISWDGSSTYCMFSTVNVTNITHDRFDVFGDYKVYNDGKNVVFEKI